MPTHTEMQEFIRKALEEDIRDGDHSSLSCIPADANGTARLLIKESGIIAGIELAKAIFSYLDPNSSFEMIKKDGDRVVPGEMAFHVQCNTQKLLQAERLALNCMQRMSAIATLTRQFVTEVDGTHAKILDTRKTTPLFRAYEKWAVLIGGGFNHRMGLYDMIMLKDNHVDFAGSIYQAIDRAVKYKEEKKLDIKIEVEARNLHEVRQVLDCSGVDRVMFDNFSLTAMKIAVELVNGKIETEASGGVNLQSVRSIAETGVDFISVGALTHSVRSMDMSLKAE